MQQPMWTKYENIVCIAVECVMNVEVEIQGYSTTSKFCLRIQYIGAKNVHKQVDRWYFRHSNDIFQY